MTPLLHILLPLLAAASFPPAATAAGIAPGGTPVSSWIDMALGLFGGLGLFLFGMDRLTTTLKTTAGGGLRRLLGRLTSNRLSGALVGAAVTAVVQSSSVTTVMVVGFVSAGAISLGQSVGVIMGANIGSTVTAQIIAFKVVKFALALIAGGYALRLFGRRERTRSHGNLLLGLGLVFFGMSLMGEGMAPLRAMPELLSHIASLETPWTGILAGALFTALIQSSAATTGIVIALASQGLLQLPGGIAVALGANIGTCVTALLAAVGKPRNALRAAAVHIMFNLLGVVLWCGFIDQLAGLATAASPQYPDLQGIARLSAETPRQIANAHTLFNVINTLLFLPLSELFARAVERLLPDRAPLSRAALARIKFLNPALLDTPSMALELARFEIAHLGEQILLMLAMARQAFRKRDERAFRDLAKQDDVADLLYAEIASYLSRLGKRALSDTESGEYYRLIHAAANLESIGDVLETDLSAMGNRMINEGLWPSPTMQLLLDDLHQGVYQALESAIQAIAGNDAAAAQDVLARRGDIERRLNAALKHRVESLASSDAEHLGTLNAEFELTDKLKRVYSLSKRIARLWVPKELASGD